MPDKQNHDAIRQAIIGLIDHLKTVTQNNGLGGDAAEYQIVTEIFLYKLFNDKFAHAARHDRVYGKRLTEAEKWDAEYDRFTDDEIDDLFSGLDSTIPRLRPEHTLAHLYNQSGAPDFSALLDGTMVGISELNADIFAVSSSGSQERIKLFEPITTVITGNADTRNQFARALISGINSFDLDEIFSVDQKHTYDFFAPVFEHFLRGYNSDGGGKYQEYYTPRAIAEVMARLLVGGRRNLTGITCYDPSAGTGTLLMALAHEVGTDRSTIYSQDISKKSAFLLRLNLILNGLTGSLPNVVQGDTLLNPAHNERNGRPRLFDFIISNPPFNSDFSSSRDKLAADPIRFWAGVPKVPKKKLNSMSIYTCFIQHLLNRLKPTGRGAIVVPTGFITAKSDVEYRILKRIVNEQWVYGAISMPSNIFAKTGTNVSVLFIDKSHSHKNVVLIDASALGEDYQEEGHKKRRLRHEDIDLIVDTFLEEKVVEEFSVVESYERIAENNYSLSAGQYFPIRMEHVEITEAQFRADMAARQAELKRLFDESHKLETEILRALDSLEINETSNK